MDQERRRIDPAIDELVRTLRGSNGTPGVMERLTKIETRQDSVEDTLKEIKQLLEKRPEPSKPEPVKPVAVPAVDTVSWTWIRDKIIQPGFLLFIGWFFFNFLPSQLGK